WVFHKVKFGQGGAQMYAYEVNGDGLNDVITSIQAHNWGLSWFEQQKDGMFKEHVIVGSKVEGPDRCLRDSGTCRARTQCRRCACRSHAASRRSLSGPCRGPTTRRDGRVP